MFWRVLFAVSILVSLVGCGTSWEKNPNREYKVWISDQFVDDHRESLVRGVNDWDKALNGYISFHLTNEENFSAIRFYPSSMLQLEQKYNKSANNKRKIGMCHHDGVGSQIEMAVDISNVDFKWVTRHEVGHALGLKHDDPNTVMCEDSTCASKNITVHDLEQFHLVWEN